MASPDRLNGISFAEQSSRHLSPPPAGLRHRPLGRASTFVEPSLSRRRSSLFSETLSDTKRAIRSSTDDLFIPSPNRSVESHDNDDDSHWQSSSIGFALLPAVGGLFYKGGDAILADLTLLVLAAIFMNWSLRVPWKWYRSAQAILPPESRTNGSSTPTIPEEDESVLTGVDSEQSRTVPGAQSKQQSSDRAAAEAELRLHELFALLSCFVCPGLAAWLLHAIRAQLSRPSEGLVSNFNLTLFIMAAELRPLSHLIKLTQRRTLFLQRRVHLETLEDHSHPANGGMSDLRKRIEELEAHIANNIVTSESHPAEGVSDEAAVKASALATADLRKSFQPEFDGLNRAMRRYEKRSTVTHVQFEARVQALEALCSDVVVLAASAQRSVQSNRQYGLVFINWLCALIVVPVEFISSLFMIPKRVYNQTIAFVAKKVPGFGWLKRSPRESKGKAVRRPLRVQAEKRSKPPP